MKAILINGSPRENGCTRRGLEEVARTLLENGIEVEFLHASFDRNDIIEAAEKLKRCDAVVLGSPVYYAAATGLMTHFCDELFGLAGRSLRLKVGASIVSARRGGCATTFDQLNKYFTISEMIQVGSNYWNMIHGNTPEEVERDEEGLQTMRILGRNIAYVLRSLEKANLPLPETEERVRTNFIRS